MTGPDYATRPEQRIDELRHEAVRRAVQLLVAGESDLALSVMRATIEHQAFLAGVGVDLPA